MEKYLAHFLMMRRSVITVVVGVALVYSSI